MTDFFVRTNGTGGLAFAVECADGGHHLGSDQALLGEVKERPRYGRLTVGGKRVLVGGLPFSIQGCSPDNGRADPCSCNGQGFILPDSNSLFSSDYQSGLKVDDMGQCIGMGRKGNSVVPVACEVCIRTSHQPNLENIESSAAESVGAREDQRENKFHIRLQSQSGQEVPNAKFVAESQDRKEKVEGVLNKQGEFSFSMKAGSCTVAFPEYDDSIAMDAFFGWQPMWFQIDSGDEPVCAVSETPQSGTPPSIDAENVAWTDLAFLFEEAPDSLEALGAIAAGTRVALNGKVAFRLEVTDFYLTMKAQPEMWQPKSPTSYLIIAKKDNPKSYLRLDRHALSDRTLKNATYDGRRISPLEIDQLRGKRLWHYNQKGVSGIRGLSVTNHEMGLGARAIGRTITIFTLAGKSLWVVGAASSLVDIYRAEDRVREVTVHAGGWTAATVGGALGCRIGTPVGAGVGAWAFGAGAAPGGFIGCTAGAVIVGGISWWTGTEVTRMAFDRVFMPLEKEEYLLIDEISEP